MQTTSAASRVAALCLLGACLFACGDEEDEPTACEARLDLYQKRLAAVPVPHAFAAIPQVAGFEPVHIRAGGQAPEVAPMLSIGVGWIALDGRKLQGADDSQRLSVLRGDLATLERNWNILHPRDAYPAVLNVSLDRRVTARQLRAIATDLLRDRRLYLWASFPGMTHPELAPACPDSLSEFCRRFDSVPAMSKPTLLADEIRKAVGACLPLIEIFAKAAEIPDAHKTSFVQYGTLRALHACKCAHLADVDAIEYLTLLTTGFFETPVRAFELTAETLASTGDDMSAPVLLQRLGADVVTR